jgi:hypothetical protein
MNQLNQTNSAVLPTDTEINSEQIPANNNRVGPSLTDMNTLSHGRTESAFNNKRYPRTFSQGARQRHGVKGASQGNVHDRPEQASSSRNSHDLSRSSSSSSSSSHESVREKKHSSSTGRRDVRELTSQLADMAAQLQANKDVAYEKEQERKDKEREEKALAAKIEKERLQTRTLHNIRNKVLNWTSAAGEATSIYDKFNEDPVTLKSFLSKHFLFILINIIALWLLCERFVLDASKDASAIEIYRDLSRDIKLDFEWQLYVSVLLFTISAIYILVFFIWGHDYRKDQCIVAWRHSVTLVAERDEEDADVRRAAFAHAEMRYPALYHTAVWKITPLTQYGAEVPDNYKHLVPGSSVKIQKLSVSMGLILHSYYPGMTLDRQVITRMEQQMSRLASVNVEASRLDNLIQNGTLLMTAIWMDSLYAKKTLLRILDFQAGVVRGLEPPLYS